MHPAFKQACDILLRDYSGQPMPQDVIDRMIEAGQKITEKLTFVSMGLFTPPAYQNNYFGQPVPVNVLTKNMKYPDPANDSPLKKFFDRMQNASPNMTREEGLANFFDMWISFFLTFLHVSSYSVTNLVGGKEEFVDHVGCIKPTSSIREINQVLDNYDRDHEKCIAACMKRIIEVRTDSVRIHKLDEEGARQDKYIVINDFASSDKRRIAYETLFESVERYLFGGDKRLKVINKYIPGPVEQVAGVPSPVLPILPTYLELFPV
ncbi:MAG: hypothetical protein NZZ41_07270 [Candidatus Dojkabacteria bacterium]|nr:hypothetical protein [Candidatus Dojkabacteria bacterium]